MTTNASCGIGAQLQLRRACIDDLAALITVDALLRTEPDRLRRVRRGLRGGDCLLAALPAAASTSLSAIRHAPPEEGTLKEATPNTHVCGYGLLTDEFFGHAFIDLLVVAPAMRRRGIGSAILQALCARVLAPGGGKDRVFTSTNTSNEPMRALLARLGFAPAGTIEHLDPGDPELVFVRFGAAADA